MTARLLETQAEGKPRVIFSAASHKPWTFSLLPDPELQLLYADTIANGASVWMGITPFEFEQPEMKSLAVMNRFLANNAEYYVKTQSAARVAVVWSDVTANFYAASAAQLIDYSPTTSRSDMGNVDGEFSGITESLLRAHIPFDVLDDVALESGPLNRYDAIFLPNVACMSDGISSRLESYVRAGGKLVADFETSRYDETGILRKDFALSKVFGASAKPKVAGPRRWDFMRPVRPDTLLQGLDREFIPSPSYYVPIATKPGDVVLQYTEPLAGRYDGVPKLSNDAAAVVNRLGKGTVVYFSGDIGNTIAKFHTPELIELLSNAGATDGDRSRSCGKRTRFGRDCRSHAEGSSPNTCSLSKLHRGDDPADPPHPSDFKCTDNAELRDSCVQSIHLMGPPDSEAKPQYFWRAPGRDSTFEGV